MIIYILLIRIRRLRFIGQREKEQNIRDDIQDECTDMNSF